MKSGERKPTLIAMSRTIVELADEASRESRSADDLRSTAAKQQTEIKDSHTALHLSENARAGLKVDVEQLKQQLNGDRQSEIARISQLELQNRELLEKLADREAIKPSPPIVLDSSDVAMLKDVIRKIRDKVPENFRSDTMKKLTAKSQRACRDIHELCEETLK